MTHKIVIPGEVIPSGNALMGHWARLVALKAKWFLLIRTNSKGCRWQKQKPKRFKIVITRYAPGTLDFANLIHSADKLILDNIKSKVRKRLPIGGGRYTYRNYLTDGLIFDDSPQYLDLVCKQKKCPEAKKRMEIIIK